MVGVTAARLSPERVVHDLVREDVPLVHVLSGDVKIVSDLRPAERLFALLEPGSDPVSSGRVVRRNAEAIRNGFVDCRRPLALVVAGRPGRFDRYRTVAAHDEQ